MQMLGLLLLMQYHSICTADAVSPTCPSDAVPITCAAADAAPPDCTADAVPSACAACRPIHLFAVLYCTSLI
jgi:hypothetical protein